MRRLKLLAPIAATLSFVVSTAALAQPYPGRHGPGDRPGGYDRPGDHDRRARPMPPPPPPPPVYRPGPAAGPAHGPGYGPGHRPGYGPGYGPGHGPAYGPRPGPAYGPDHRFARGQWLPPAYRSRHYVIGDWRAHHLRYPPPGYQWVQWGADYLLVAIATGLIAEVVLGR